LVQEGHTATFRTVLACVDFSATARQVVAQAMHVAAIDHGQIHFLHLFDSPWRRLAHLRPIPEAVGHSGRHKKSLQDRLHEFVETDQGHQVFYDLEEASSVGQGISDSARSIHADLIVLGTRGHTNIKQVLLGSTAERVLRDVPCSILAVRPPAA
jgi:universal stress protein E